MELPEDVREQLAGFEAAVASVEHGLEPLLQADRRELEAALSPVERAKVHVTLANAVTTLFCSASPALRQGCRVWGVGRRFRVKGEGFRVLGFLVYVPTTITRHPLRGSSARGPGARVKGLYPSNFLHPKP